jgi:hypothetical protein
MQAVSFLIFASMSAIAAAEFDKLRRRPNRFRASEKSQYSFRDDATEPSAL